MSRKDRVEHAMRDELAQLIAREVHDPRVAAAGVVGVSRVECTPDFSVANVWISIYATDAVAAKAIAGLKTAAGFLRGPLARRLHLGRPPELRFHHDRSSEVALQLAAIVREDQAMAVAVGRTATGTVAEATADVAVTEVTDAAGGTDAAAEPGADPAAALGVDPAPAADPEA